MVYCKLIRNRGNTNLFKIKFKIKNVMVVEIKKDKDINCNEILTNCHKYYLDPERPLSSLRIKKFFELSLTIII